jgi:hypothetical protein
MVVADIRDVLTLQPQAQSEKQFFFYRDTFPFPFLLM